MEAEEKNKPIAAVIQKIAKECEESGCSAWTVTKIVKEISKEEKISEKKLRKKALEILEGFDPAAAKVYASFQRMNVRTSKQTIEPFDRGNIIRSLLKETDVTRGVAEKIGREVEDEIKDLEISYISTALIREMVNVKLLGYGHENIRNQYARLGLPVFDVEKRIKSGPYNCRDVLSEYNLLRVIPPKLGEMHLQSELFIASLDSFSTKPIAYSHTFEEKESLNETILFNLKRMNQFQKMVAWPVNASNINTSLLSFSSKRKMGKTIDFFTQAFEAVFPQTSIPRNLSINLFLQEASENIERELIGHSANLFLDKKEKFGKLNARITVAIDTKYKLKLLKKNSLQKVTILNCKEKEMLHLNGIAAEKNLCGMFGLNLVKAAPNSKEQEFFGNLEHYIKAIKELAELKEQILLKKEYLKKENIDVKEMVNAVGLYGLYSAAKKITQSDKQKEIAQFAERIVASINKSLSKDFVLTELLNQKAIERFEATNKKRECREKANKVLAKSKGLLKNFQMNLIAENKKEATEFIDKDVLLIDLA